MTSKSKTLDEIFIEARGEYNTALIDGDGYEACIFLGVKISKDNTSGEIKIYDPSKSVNYYVEVDKQTYLMFPSHDRMCYPLLSQVFLCT